MYYRISNLFLHLETQVGSWFPNQFLSLQACTVVANSIYPDDNSSSVYQTATSRECCLTRRFFCDRETWLGYGRLGQAGFINLHLHSFFCF